MQLINHADGSCRMPVCEIMVNSPKVSKHIDAGEIKEITEEMENSVSYYRMQTMNQSLIALLAHNTITYEQAVDASLEPEDLSLRLRKMFPSIEERFREGEMAPSPADFSEITGLLETKKLYEEAEEVHRAKIAERDEVIGDLERELADLRLQTEQASDGSEELRREAENATAEVARIRDESQAKINALNERIRDLNEKLSGNGKGFFKR